MQKWDVSHHLTWWQVLQEIPAGNKEELSHKCSPLGRSRRDKNKHEVVPAKSCPELWPCKALHRVAGTLWKIKTKVWCLHNRHSLSGTKTSSLIYLENDLFYPFPSVEETMAVLGELVSPWVSCWRPGKSQQTVLVSLCLQKEDISNSRDS